MTSEILVWSDDDELLGQLTSEARRLGDDAGFAVGVVRFKGDALQEPELAGRGADVAYVIDADASHPDTCVDALADVIIRTTPRLVMMGATRRGMEAAPRLAERLDCGYVPWTTEVQIEATDGAITASRMLFAGVGRVVCRCEPALTILTSSLGAFEALALEGRSIHVEALDAEALDSRLEIVDWRPKASGGEGLEQAKVIVDCGKGIRERHDLDMLRQLATLLDGQLACSRPMASDRDWFQDWLGLSGARLKPELCLTVGVSGAVQHIVGIRDSRVIAAINNEEDSPIFTQADIGVLADLYEFVPALLERLQARDIHPSWS